MRNTIIVTVLLFIAVIAASIYYFSDNSSKQKNATKALQYLPADTYFIATFKNDQATDTIFQNFELFEAIQGKQSFDNLKKIKQDFLRSDGLKENVYDKEIILSYHPSKAGIATLYTVALHKKLNDQELATIFHSIDKKYKLIQTDTLDHTIYSFDQGVKDSLLYCTLHENILFASYERSLIHQVIDKKVPKLDAKQIEFFIPVIHRDTCIGFGIYSLPITRIECTIGTHALVFFKTDINDTRVSRCIIFTGRVGNDLYPVNTVAWQTTQIIHQVCTTHGGRFSINHDDNTLPSF